MITFRAFLYENVEDEYHAIFPKEEDDKRTPADRHRNRYIFHVSKARIYQSNTRIIPDTEPELQRVEHMKYLHHKEAAKHHWEEYRKLSGKKLYKPDEDK